MNKKRKYGDRIGGLRDDNKGTYREILEVLRKHYNLNQSQLLRKLLEEERKRVESIFLPEN